VNLRERVPLAPLTTLGLGGPARWLAECRSDADVREALVFAQARELPVVVLGGGSNVVVADAGFPGLVLHVAIGGIAWEPERDGTVRVTAGAGERWDDLVAASVGRGLQGLECLSGIPGTVGGTPIQNVGAYGQEVAETIVEVTCLERERGERVVLPAAACGFGYRRSRFKRDDAGRYVVTAVTYRLREGAPPSLRYPELERAVAAGGGLAGLAPAEGLGRVRQAVLALRRGKAMAAGSADPDARSAGSFFTNPVISAGAFAELSRRWEGAGGGAIPSFPDAEGVKVSAAWLVEQAGFPKGTQRGGAAVSTKHALALVNLGGTTAELLALADAIVGAVEARFGVRLEREPVVVGPATTP